jgi:hypothetical protein
MLVAELVRDICQIAVDELGAEWDVNSLVQLRWHQSKAEFAAPKGQAGRQEQS